MYDNLLTLNRSHQNRFQKPRRQRSWIVELRTLSMSCLLFLMFDTFNLFVHLSAMCFFKFWIHYVWFSKKKNRGPFPNKNCYCDQHLIKTKYSISQRSYICIGLLIYVKLKVLRRSPGIWLTGEWLFKEAHSAFLRTLLLFIMKFVIILFVFCIALEISSCRPSRDEEGKFYIIMINDFIFFFLINTNNHSNL